jgi:hypothetical protein
MGKPKNTVKCGVIVGSAFIVVVVAVAVAAAGGGGVVVVVAVSTNKNWGPQNKLPELILEFAWCSFRASMEFSTVLKRTLV